MTTEGSILNTFSVTLMRSWLGISTTACFKGGSGRWSSSRHSYIRVPLVFLVVVSTKFWIFTSLSSAELHNTNTVNQSSCFFLGSTLRRMARTNLYLEIYIVIIRPGSRLFKTWGEDRNEVCKKNKLTEGKSYSTIAHLSILIFVT